MSIKASILALIALGAPLLLAAPPAYADDAKKDDAKKDDAKKAEVVDDKWDPFEDPNKTYRFIGLRFRDAILPQFMMNWFARGGRNVNVPMVGPEFITRHDHLELGIALMYADYAMDPFLFQGKGDPPTSWELVASSLKLGYVMFDILYEIPIEKRSDGKTGRFAFLIGGGIGIAGVFGTLYRSQAYPNNMAAAGNTNDPSGWSACTGAGMQGSNNLSPTYCDTRSNHYAGPGGNVYTGYTEPSWINSGSKPMIFPWIALPQLSFRYKPIKQFQTKVDLGFSSTGIFFGLSASYGIPSSSDASSSTSSGSSSK
jgi:hypothetical protein